MEEHGGASRLVEDLRWCICPQPDEIQEMGIEEGRWCPGVQHERKGPVAVDAQRDQRQDGCIDVLDPQWHTVL
jgi:hypothetical protein